MDFNKRQHTTHGIVNCRRSGSFSGLARIKVRCTLIRNRNVIGN